MATTIPSTISQAAADYVAEKGLNEPFQRMRHNLPKRIPHVQSIAVSLQEPLDLGGGPRVVFDVMRAHPGTADDASERQWERWVVENFPPSEFEHFVLLSAYKGSHAG